MITAVRNFIARADVGVKLHHYKIKHYSPNIPIAIERGPYLVKTAENASELANCLKLRFEVFHREYMEKRRNVGVDVDHLDSACDHLMIIDKRSDAVVGTYRLNLSLFNDVCYSTSEFHMRKVLELEGPRLELGRACIHRDHRTGSVIALLWRGLAEYIRQSRTQVLFGCSSVKTMEPMRIAGLVKYLRDSNLLDPELEVQPTPRFCVPQLDLLIELLDRHDEQYRALEIESSIPALFRSYIRMGAKFGSGPALDREFRCVDFLTIMKTAEIGSGIKAKFDV